jgi:hypothetical protein
MVESLDDSAALARLDDIRSAAFLDEGKDEKRFHIECSCSCCLDRTWDEEEDSETEEEPVIDERVTRVMFFARYNAKIRGSKIVRVEDLLTGLAKEFALLRRS